MEMKTAQKIAYIANSALMLMVIAMMAFFKMLGVGFLVYFSIPTLMVYILSYWLVYRERLELYVWVLYGWIALYMCVTTICLGTAYGFYLYCFSLIPVVYVLEYMSFKLGRNGIKALVVSLCIAVCYMICMGYVSKYGPVYDKGNKYSTGFMLFNSLSVFGFLIVYANYIINNIIRSEKRLGYMAHRDRLTELYNRHYMLEKLSALPEDGSAGILAMADIDDFKKINDTYGHNAGDEVLRTISERMTKACSGCDIARWGGEEFLIHIRADEKYARAVLERMCYDVSRAPVVFDGVSINVTVTVGVAGRNSGESLDEWIHNVDKKLYTGKKDGKNKVVA